MRKLVEYLGAEAAEFSELERSARRWRDLFFLFTLALLVISLVVQVLFKRQLCHVTARL